MSIDTVRYDSVAARPLPKWLTDQKEGLATVQAPRTGIKEDHSLVISLAVTGGMVLLIVAIFTIFILRKNKNKRQ